MFLTLILSASLITSCSSNKNSGSDPSKKTDKPLVLTTFTVLKDIAQTIAGNHLTVESITSPDEEIHDFQPSPEDIKRGEKAKLILENGLGLERWFKKFTANSKAEVATISEGITPIPIAEGDYKDKPNPHAWMSPKNGKVYVDNIVKAFSKIDPDHASDFQSNAKAYKEKLDKISADMEAKLAKLPENQRALVTCEGAFSYLTRDHGLTEKYLWAVNAEGALTPQRVAEVENFVKQSKISAVFCESTVEDKMKPIVESTGVTYGGTLYVDSLSKADGPVPTYLDLLRYDADTITKGLTSQAK